MHSVMAAFVSREKTLLSKISLLMIWSSSYHNLCLFIKHLIIFNYWMINILYCFYFQFHSFIYNILFIIIFWYCIHYFNAYLLFPFRLKRLIPKKKMFFGLSFDFELNFDRAHHIVIIRHNLCDFHGSFIRN